MWVTIWHFITGPEPDGPSTPFGPGVWEYDILRIVTLVCVATVIAFTIPAVKRSRVLGQKARIISATIAFVGVLGTEIEHFGDLVHWRLYFNFVASVMMAWGYWSLFYYEDPSSLRPNGTL